MVWIALSLAFNIVGYLDNAFLYGPIKRAAIIILCSTLGYALQTLPPIYVRM